MKKLFTLFAGLTMFLSSVLAATETTVYYAVPSSVVGTFDVKLNVNRKGDGDDWKQYAMTLTDKTYQSKLIYSCTFTDLYDGLGKMQLQLYSGSSWQSQVEPITSWTVASVYNGKMWVHDETAWFDYTYDTTDPSVILSVSPATVEPNTLITLTAEASNFEGEVSYAYSYSTTGAEPFTALAGNTFTPEAEGTYTFKVVATDGVDEASATKVVTVAVVHYYLKHPFDGSNWTVKELTIKNAGGTYSLFAGYGGSGCNYGTTTSTTGWNSNPTVNGAVKGDWCKFTYNPADNSIVIDKVTTSFTVAASAENGDVAVSAAEVLDHQPATFTATNTVPGYFFTGWYSNEALTEEVSKENPYTMPEIVESTTLYAKFEAETTYTITLEDATEESVEAGATVNPTITAAVKPGFTFKEWTATDGIVIANAASATTTISATAAGTVTATYNVKNIYLKNGWGIGSWSWKQAANNGDGTYTINNYYSKTGYNVNTVADDEGSSWKPLDEDAKNGKWVTATYNDADGSISIVESMPTANLAGSFNEWAQDAMVVVDNEDNTYSASLVKHLAAGSYTFKVVVGGAWLGNSGTMTRENCSGWTFAAGDDCGLTADIEGDYTFTLTITAASIKLTVAYPTTYSLAIGAAGWATLSLPFAVNIPEDLEAYYVSENNAGTLTLTQIQATDGIPANEGVLIKKLSGESPYEFSGVASATAISGNLLHANLTAGTVATVVGATQYYKLLNGTHGLGWYLGAEDGGVFTLGANKAYLALSGSQAQVRFVLEDMLNNGYVTALENKALNVEVKKALIDGKIVILRGGNMFDLNGRIVK